MTVEKSQLTRRRVRVAWLFLTPMLVTIVAVAGWPLLRTFWLSLTNATLSGNSVTEFIGFANYLEIYDGEFYGVLADPLWWQSVYNTLYFTVVSVGLETVLGILVALALNMKFPGRSIVRAAVLIPWAIPTVVSAKLWGWMLHDQFGMVNDLLMTLHLISEPLAWTADPDLMMTSIIMVDVWKTTPFMALLVLAALQMLPSDCYEAAKIDGIHPVKVFFKVTLPLITPALLVAVVFRALDALRIFDLIYVLTPASEDTMSMSVYARQNLVDFQDVGYGSAASTLLFFVVALCTILYLYISRRSRGGLA
ncbi:carbohydrate ABC transporter permease [Salinibius halmophilus]|uniref:carbohydrate ABC transporter permease n=1 Tax=Salinibius halmophilus TaxID=1853216 RepID=UPI000E670BAA|nr:sugar ABC transporter permease [Salinibius halmophilus]